VFGQEAVLEALVSSRGSHVRVLGGAFELEVRTQSANERVGIVAGDVEPAASRRTIRGERCDHSPSVRLQGGQEAVDVPFAVVGIREEVEHGAVVPKRHGLGR
jgi:hypothetical protein